jgi:peptidyl-prolyl cis-trans isomerase B (cyclophilin B)
VTIHRPAALVAIGLLVALVGCEDPAVTTEPVAEPVTEQPLAEEPVAEQPVNEEQPVNDTPDPAANPVIIIDTSMGVIEVELWPEASPKTVENFLGYVDQSFFDGTIFHRVMPGFMIQGGGFAPDMSQKPVGQPVENEAQASVGNDRGTIAMARTSDPHSATAQFFINHTDNPNLDHSSKTPNGYGYCVFGKVTVGMDVVDAIAAVKTTNAGMHQNVPAQPVTIVSIRRK